MPTVLLIITLLGREHPLVVMEYSSLVRCLTDGAAMAEEMVSNHQHEKYFLTISCAANHGAEKPA